jgi:nucleoside-diphosphate-sugar epimerase
MSDATGKVNLTPFFAAERAGDLKHSYADLARARALLGYEPVVNFEQGLSETLAWYRRRALT